MVRKPQVLHKVIFSAEGGSLSLALTGTVIMRIEMLGIGIKHAAICTVRSPGFRGNHRAAEWSASPALEVEMKRLFMSGPVILALEGVTAECAREYPLFFVLLFHLCCICPSSFHHPAAGTIARTSKRCRASRGVGSRGITSAAPKADG